MKRYIRSSREYNSARAAQYQSKQAAKQAAKQLESQRVAYVRSIEDEVRQAVSDDIESAIFQPVLNDSEIVDKWLDYDRSTYSEYYDEYGHLTDEELLTHSADVWIVAKSEYIELSVGVFGPAAENRGLEWVADLATGGDGDLNCLYISKLPARMKHKFDDYKDIIADSIERLGFDILEAPKNDSDGFVFKISNDDYDALTA